jgi:hypothetical protein
MRKMKDERKIPASCSLVISTGTRPRPSLRTLPMHEIATALHFSKTEGPRIRGCGRRGGRRRAADVRRG